MKKKRKFIMLLACFCIIASCFSFTVPAGAESDKTTIASDLKELERKTDELETLRKEQKAWEKQLNEAQGQYENKLAEKNAINVKLSYIAEDIKATESLIYDYNEYIEKLLDECYTQQLLLDEYYEIYNNILCYYYEYGEASSLEILLQSKNISDFITRLDYLNYVIEYNNTITDKILETKTNFETLLNEQRTASENLKIHKASLEESKNQYQEDKAVLDKLLVEANEMWELSESQLQQIKSDEKQLLGSMSEIEKQIKEKEIYVTGSYGFPISGIYWNSIYAASAFDTEDSSVLYNGIDIAAESGTPVQAVKDGIVTISESRSNGLGEVIIINHQDGTSTLYGYCSERYVKVNQRVLKGQVIGRVGATGTAERYQLRFCVLLDGTTYDDPIKHLDSEFLNKINKKGILTGIKK